MDCYSGQRLLFGDLHNHCAISYGHGSLEDALRNARERLDFVSVTGHAHWPDMPARDGEIDYIIDFHEMGFAKLKAGWPGMMRTLKEFDEEGRFIVFPGFEVHFCATGDRNIVYRDLAGEILYPDNVAGLHRMLREQGVPAFAQPHHVGYRQGTRGIDWTSHDPEWAPFVEMLSMHGCSEASENTRPFLHSMGPSDGESTIRTGLQQGRIFGFSGGTDHHSAHPGSYGHGMTGLWADSGNRADVWHALRDRRMFALTGDRMDLRFTVNDAPMGCVTGRSEEYRCHYAVNAGGPIDCVDLLSDGVLIKRISQCDFPSAGPQGGMIHTKLFLELGWGARRRECQWDATFGISDGEILAVEPRFRGREVVSPVEGEAIPSCYLSRVTGRDAQSVRFETRTQGNPNNATPTMQGMCLEVRMPRKAEVRATLNGRTVAHPLTDLLAGARSGRLGDIDSPAWRFHRAPEPHEWRWEGSWTVALPETRSLYLRVRQNNDQWAWSSPVFPR